MNQCPHLTSATDRRFSAKWRADDLCKVELLPNDDMTGSALFKELDESMIIPTTALTRIIC